MGDIPKEVANTLKPAQKYTEKSFLLYSTKVGLRQTLRGKPDVQCTFGMPKIIIGLNYFFKKFIELSKIIIPSFLFLLKFFKSFYS